MDLDTVIQSEVSQKEKITYCISAINMEAREMVQTIILEIRDRHSDGENQCMDTKGKWQG